MMSFGGEGDGETESPVSSSSLAIDDRFCWRMLDAVLCITSDIFFTFCTARFGVHSTSFRRKEGGPSLDRNGANCRTRDKEKMVGLK